MPGALSGDVSGALSGIWLFGAGTSGGVGDVGWGVGATSGTGAATGAGGVSGAAGTGFFPKLQPLKIATKIRM